MARHTDCTSGQVLKYISDSPATPAPTTDFAPSWRQLESTAQLHDTPYIDEAIKLARSLRGPADELHVLVTGSQHLVGGVLVLLDHGV